MPMNREDVLRERSRLLLKQLGQPKERLEREAEPGGEERRRQPGMMATLPDGERRAPRAVVAKPTVRFADTCELHRDIQHSNSPPFRNTNYCGGPTEHTALSDLLEDSYIYPQPINKLEETRPPTAESCSIGDDKDLREVQDRVTPHTDENMSASDRYHLQPLLGYDWIAGVLETEDSMLERSDEFFKDLCVFRSLYKSECIHNGQTEFCEESRPVSPLLMGKNDHRANIDHHHCTFSYRINSRLFPVPLHAQECCPVCKKHRSSHPHTAAEPALVRVSIPRTTLLPTHKYKAHRRCSFDPSDSLGLPSHCLSGWSNRSQSTLPPPSSLDLRSSLKMKNPGKSWDNQLQDLHAPTESESQRFDPISDVSRLARHNFQHLSPRRKCGKESTIVRKDKTLYLEAALTGNHNHLSSHWYYCSPTYSSMNFPVCLADQ